MVCLVCTRAKLPHSEELVAQLEQVTREQVAQAAQKLELDTIYFLKGTEG